ncbi:hypothetical protein JXB11_02420 [Candidatus Woesearchaeota archaeon]|nr:hypothetical protein [Candidatus Woesearchaeota archaeon]
MKAIPFIILLFLLAGTALAFEPKIIPSEEDVVYPTLRAIDVEIVFDKGPLDDIEDIEYNLTITGSATFEDGTRLFEGTLEKLDETYEKALKVSLRDTRSAAKEYIQFRLQGEYISNAIIGGGKKYIDITKNVSIISTEKAMVEEEKNIYQKMLDDCTEERASLLNEVEQLRGIAPLPEPECEPCPFPFLPWGISVLLFALLVWSITSRKR